MRTARVCNKWDLDFNFELKDEGDRSLHQRSYLHYAAEHTDLVACKAYATEWLLKDIIDEDKEYGAVEYMAGIGIQTIIAQNTFKIFRHLANELDEGCANHLHTSNFPVPLAVLESDAKEMLMRPCVSDLKFADFPNSSILRITKDWKDGFPKLFENDPELVVWTDTSVTYPMSLHGEKYGKILDAEIKTTDDYVNAYSKWLYKNYGYSIRKAAFRHRNAVYFAAIKGEHETEMKHFKLKETLDGFYFLDDKVATLDEFM